jgi:hypothetical protein
MSEVTLTDGRSLFTFYSKSAKKLVRINEEELKKALLGQSFIFSFSEAARNDRGWNTLVTVQEDKARYGIIAPNLKQEFLDIIMEKKFQVSVDRMGSSEAYVSPITGIEYKSYFDYLTSEDEFKGQPRTEGKGANVILATDSPGNAYKSPFYDVGIEFSRLSASNGNTGTAIEIDTNQVTRSLDSLDAQKASQSTTTTADQKADIERRREEDKNKPAPVTATIQTVSQVNTEEWDADLFGAAPVIEQEPVSSSGSFAGFNLPNLKGDKEAQQEFKNKEGLTPNSKSDLEKELKNLNPNGAPMQDLGDEIIRKCKK